MRWTTWALLAAALTGGAAAASEPRRGVCRAQIAEDVRARLGQHVTDVEIRYYDAGFAEESPIWRGTAIVRTRECTGYHHYVVHAGEFECEILPHYGEAPSYAVYASSEDGC